MKAKKINNCHWNVRGICACVKHDQKCTFTSEGTWKCNNYKKRKKYEKKRIIKAPRAL